MGATDPVLVLLVAATALHLGFQVTVTALVYPALARTDPADWDRVHRAHSRAITPVVAAVYSALLLVGALAVSQHPGDGFLLTAAVAGVGAVTITALLAAPAHGRLARDRNKARIRRLLWIDRGRTLAAAVSFGAAVTAAL